MYSCSAHPAALPATHIPARFITAPHLSCKLSHLSITSGKYHCNHACTRNNYDSSWGPTTQVHATAFLHHCHWSKVGDRRLATRPVACSHITACVWVVVITERQWSDSMSPWKSQSNRGALGYSLSLGKGINISSTIWRVWKVWATMRSLAGTS